ncbi:DinB family protein [Polaribacter ponticola]|uniref:DinB family protein n=1 Tax=Polaribacter ponticola TaxID=2978475 RepID=A0ABT5S8Q3_9FLAO|nr:DinB family protein [Polaribacter sp. MSW5]MDD7914503.1 DinB family protein [Polaribacter sp. MSW5]
MIEAIEKNLQRGINLLKNISDDEYSNNSIQPYYSSIGCHMRHVLDVFSCVLTGFKNENIDLTIRERNELAEQKTTVGIDYFNKVIDQVCAISNNNLKSEITVSDDLGSGKITVNTTLEAALMQAQSHAIHHYASVGYLIYQLGIELPDADFGFNPTTPKKQEVG